MAITSCTNHDHVFQTHTGEQMYPAPAPPGAHSDQPWLTASPRGTRTQLSASPRTYTPLKGLLN